MARLDIERQKELEPKRIEFAKNALTNLGFEPIVFEKKITFMFKDELVTLFPFSGWHTGKTIKDGRGIENLIKQIKN